MLPPAPCQGDRRGRDDLAGGSTLTLILIRHTPVLVALGVCYGRLDVALRADAAVDIAAIVARLGGVRPDTVRTSPSSRCRVLADAIAEARGGLVVEDSRLQELDFGAWEGMAWDDVPRAALDLWAADLVGFAPPGGESGAALVARCRASYAAVPLRGCHVVVSHGGPLRVLAALAAGAEVDLGVAAQAPGEVRVFVGAAPRPEAGRQGRGSDSDPVKGSPLETCARREVGGPPGPLRAGA